VGALESLRRCYQLASGYRLPLLGVVLLGTGLSAVGFLLCCVGALPAFAFYQVMVGALFLALRAPEPAPGA
jgi:hypothetical protein